VLVTPQMAAKWLQDGGANYRRIRQLDVDKYARAMANGEWKLNGEPLIFDENMKLIDGWHRCTACVQSKAEFETFVIKGLSRSVLETIDSGKSRTFNDIMRALNKPLNSGDLALAKGIEYSLTFPNYWNVRFGVPSLETYEAVNLIEKYQDGITQVKKAGKHKVAVLVPFVHAFYYLPEKRARLAHLIEVLHSGESDDPKDQAIILLRNLSHNYHDADKSSLFYKSQFAVRAALQDKNVVQLQPVKKILYPITEDENGNIVADLT
jgi:hypothetical protein